MIIKRIIIMIMLIMIRFDVLIINLQDGFTSESTAVVHLWKILNEFNEDEKKMFLKFVTGRLVRKVISPLTIHPSYSSHLIFSYYILTTYNTPF